MYFFHLISTVCVPYLDASLLDQIRSPVHLPGLRWFRLRLWNGQRSALLLQRTSRRFSHHRVRHKQTRAYYLPRCKFLAAVHSFLLFIGSRGSFSRVLSSSKHTIGSIVEKSNGDVTYKRSCVYKCLFWTEHNVCLGCNILICPILRYTKGMCTKGMPVSIPSWGGTVHHLACTAQAGGYKWME